jgi:hypothetical protein
MAQSKATHHPRTRACTLYLALDAGMSAGDRCAPGEEPTGAATDFRREWRKGYAAGREARYARIRAERTLHAAVRAART